MNLTKILPAILLAACASPQLYEAEQPKMDFIAYFSGITHGYGAVYDIRGRLTDRFHVLMNGKPGTDEAGRRTLYLAEDFTYTSGKTQKRAWSVIQTGQGKLTATAVDVPGFAEGEESGNAVRFRYPITITRENGSQMTLSSEDWMWMMPGNTLLNRNTLYKFGLPVAELVINFTKNP